MHPCQYCLRDNIRCIGVVRDKTLQDVDLKERISLPLYPVGVHPNEWSMLHAYMLFHDLISLTGHKLISFCATTSYKVLSTTI